MRNYEDFEIEVRRRQDLALARARRPSGAGAVASRPAAPPRLRVAEALRHLAAWVEGAEPACSVTLRPS